jgi:hypothetical protein
VTIAMRRASASLRHLVWTCAFACLFMLPFVQSSARAGALKFRALRRRLLPLSQMKRPEVPRLRFLRGEISTCCLFGRGNHHRHRTSHARPDSTAPSEDNRSALSSGRTPARQCYWSPNTSTCLSHSASFVPPFCCLAVPRIGRPSARRAAILAAIRLGSSTRMFPRTFDNNAGGMRVVLPAPVGAGITRLRPGIPN